MGKHTMRCHEVSQTPHLEKREPPLQRSIGNGPKYTQRYVAQHGHLKGKKDCIRFFKEYSNMVPESNPDKAEIITACNEAIREDGGTPSVPKQKGCCIVM